MQPGYFSMGANANDHEALSSEKPAIVVRVAKAYAIGRMEVTVGQYMTFVRATGANAPACSSPIYTRDPALPLSCVSWREAQAYVTWLRQKTGKAYRLPTEAEWEYAARGGATTPYTTGADIEEGQANIGRERFARIAAGSYPVNGFGLADVHGSVAEPLATAGPIPTAAAAATAASQTSRATADAPCCATPAPTRRSIWHACPPAVRSVSTRSNQASASASRATCDRRVKACNCAGHGPTIHEAWDVGPRTCSTQPTPLISVRAGCRRWRRGGRWRGLPRLAPWRPAGAH